MVLEIKKPLEWTPEIYMGIARACGQNLWFGEIEGCLEVEARGKCEMCNKGNRILLQGCLHCNYCEDCLRGWLKGQTLARYPGRCPCLNCDKLVSIAELEYLFQDNTVTLERLIERRIRAFLRNQEGWHWCPQCDWGGFGLDDDVAIRCSSCHYVFCPSCKNNHVGQKCIDIRDCVTNQNWKNKYAKPCPGCGIAIEKDGGCPGVVCLNCHELFDWYGTKRNTFDKHILKEADKEIENVEYSTEIRYRERPFLVKRKRMCTNNGDKRSRLS